MQLLLGLLVIAGSDGRSQADRVAARRIGAAASGGGFERAAGAAVTGEGVGGDQGPPASLAADPGTAPTTAADPGTTGAPPPTAAPTTPVPKPAAPPSTARRSQTASASVAQSRAASFASYRGLGTWVDVYDWSMTYTKGNPGVGPETVDAMAAQGVQTLYIQASKWDSPTGDILEPDRLSAIISRAHQKGIKVSAWYLPKLLDPGADVARMVAIAKLPIDSFGVDIEATDVGDPGERSRRIVAVSAALRAAVPRLALAAIVLPPVVIEDLNANYWPDFPWKALQTSYDVWMPMAYWTNRKDTSEWRDARHYTVENARRIRAHLGDAKVPIHVVGGIGDRTSVADATGFYQGALDVGAIGGSIYDWRTTGDPLWAPLRAFRSS